MPCRGASSARRPYRLRTLLWNLQLRGLRCTSRSQNPLQNWTNTDGEQRLLSISQKVDHATLGVAQINTLSVGEQMQTSTARNQLCKRVSELAAQQRHQLANALQAEASLAQIAQHSEFS